MVVFGDKKQKSGWLEIRDLPTVRRALGTRAERDRIRSWNWTKHAQYY